MSVTEEDGNSCVLYWILVFTSTILVCQSPTFLFSARVSFEKLDGIALMVGLITLTIVKLNPFALLKLIKTMYTMLTSKILLRNKF